LIVTADVICWRSTAPAGRRRENTPEETSMGSPMPLPLRILRPALAALSIAAGAALLWPAGARASEAPAWPTRPVTLVVPFGAGGSTDGVARVIAKELSDRLGQQFVIENKAGAAGNIAAATVAKAPADGYALLLTTTGPASVNRLLYKSPGYDADKDFSPIILIGLTPQAVVVSPKRPADSLAGLIAQAKSNAKAHAETLTFGNSGVGTMAHITAVSLARAAGLDVTHVTYRGGAQAMTDILGGQIDVGFPAYVPNLGGLKVLAITSAERMRSLPAVPTVRETGVADIVSGTWFGIVAPANTPAEVVTKVNGAVNDFLKSQRARDLFDDLGILPLGGTPAAMKAYVAEETARWEPIVRSINLRLD
jgi:tripartite-type tricarboxylate transporter receptor subunit TctC